MTPFGFVDWTAVLGVITLLLFIEVAWVSVNDPL